jgi:acyl-CoA thioesterase-1
MKVRITKSAGKNLCKLLLCLLFIYVLAGCDRQDKPSSNNPQPVYNWQVINGGISGETSSGALTRINWIIAQKPDIVILETGANDGMRGIPTWVIKDNISQAAKLLKEAGVEVILAGMQMLQNLGPDYTKEFAAVYPAVAQEQKILLIPFFLEQVAGTPSLNLPDFIHPTPEGHRIVAQTVYPYVVKAIQARRLDRSAKNKKNR